MMRRPSASSKNAAVRNYPHSKRSPLLFSEVVMVLLVILLPHVSLPASCQALVLYVIPDQVPTSDCPSGEVCQTLSYYASNASLLTNKESISLLFLNGSHTLFDQNLEISDVQDLTLAGVGDEYDVENPQVVITLVTMVIKHVSILEIQNVSLVGPAGSQVQIKISFVQCVLTNQVTVHQAGVVVTGANFIQFSRARYFNSNVTLYQRASANASESTKLIVGACVFDSSILNVEAINRTGAIGKLEEEFYDTLVYGSEGIHFEMYGGRVSIVFKNCSIYRTMYGVSVYNQVQESNFSLSLELTDCVLNKNNGSIRFAASTYEDENLVQDFERTNMMLHMKNVLFSNNIINPNIFVTGPATVIVDNCLFHENVGIVTTFYLHSTYIFFTGSTVFSDNIGGTGGALYLSNSVMWLNHQANITFVNNTVDRVGGAIYVQEFILDTFLDVVASMHTSRLLECFYQLTFNLSFSDVNKMSAFVFFTNNSAAMGGDNIYGASLKDDCTVTPDKQTKSYLVQSKIFHFRESDTSLSSVASEPRRPCLCENNAPQCDDLSYIHKRMFVTSGERFNLSFVLVGDDFGVVTGGIYASNPYKVTAVELGERQDIQQVRNVMQCTTLEYSIHSNETEATIIFNRNGFSRFTVQDIPRYKETIDRQILAFHEEDVIGLALSFSPVFILLNFLPCPAGFQLTGDPPACQCGDFLSVKVNKCVVQNGTGVVYRNGTTWVGILNETNGTGISASRECPIDYCKSDFICVDPHAPDVQCAFNHGGILCGGCLPGYSIALGSSRCLLCPNNGYIALILVFIAASFSLVFFIKILDLTVTRGTVNGLIFYANVIWINKTIFFPQEDSNLDQSLLLYFNFLRVFTAWLNLDFGIETCFIQGLDTYWKTWLQLVYPILVIGIIIIACRYSITVTKVLGNNAVPVLVTLILISYLKLLRTIVIIVASTNIPSSSNPKQNVLMVWSEDGNVEYFGVQHSFLFVAAIFALLILVLPYTVLLTFLPVLRRIRKDYRIILWINKLKPFLDAHYGSLKDNRYYWIGVTLIARLFIFLTARYFLPDVHLIVVTAVCSVLITIVMDMYKSFYNCLLEATYLFNLIMVCVAFLSTDSFETRVTYTCISVTVSFLLFLCTFTFHLYTELNKHCNLRLKCLHIDQRVTIRKKSRMNDQNIPLSLSSTPTTTEVEFIAYRESLLDSTTTS